MVNRFMTLSGRNVEESEIVLIIKRNRHEIVINKPKQPFTFYREGNLVTNVMLIVHYTGYILDCFLEDGLL